MCSEIATAGRISILLGREQAKTGKRISVRKLAEIADVPKDFLYRLDAGTARHVDLQSLARLCDSLHCSVQDILVLQETDAESL